MIYEPQEDSYLLAEEVRKHAKGKCLDVGTGTGIQIMNAWKASSRLGVDINPEAVKYCGSMYKEVNVEFKVSDLFSAVKGKFDTIIFNPPYLPDDPRVKDIALDGGKKGYEVFERFMTDVNEHLESDGQVLLLFSSLTKKDKVDSIIDDYLMDKELISLLKLDFEVLYVYKIAKSKLRKELEQKGMSEIKYLAKGKRGKVYSGMLGRKKAAIKVERDDIDAIERITNETRWLKKLNIKGIGPKFMFSGRNYAVMEFIDGKTIKEFVEIGKKKEIVKVLKNVLKQCFVMDSICVNKGEMHHPYKHILVPKNPDKSALIDFERCKITQKPKNVTQFVQFIVSLGYGDKMRDVVKEYKKEMSEKNFNKLFRIISA